MGRGKGGKGGGIGESNLRSNRQKPGSQPVAPCTDSADGHQHLIYLSKDRKPNLQLRSFSRRVRARGGDAWGMVLSPRRATVRCSQCGSHHPQCGSHHPRVSQGGVHREGVHTCVQIWTSKFWVLDGRFGRPLCSCHASRPRPTRSLPPPLHPRLVGSTSLCAQSGFWVQFLCELKVTVRLASSEPTVSW